MAFPVAIQYNELKTNEITVIITLSAIDNAAVYGKMSIVPPFPQKESIFNCMIPSPKVIRKPRCIVCICIILDHLATAFWAAASSFLLVVIGVTVIRLEAFRSRLI